ncbi:unnamed protein product [Kluyveromyces dobzhanskii CBS 2104]|uniref:WGS project CCBQ000000000 data, contig 00102 n=1 Tax=Kluyveromyces dobzhanskii CBS 2104 TaxID=1427455 RepID=A0A0A8L6E2_9SACH|nr:unnamed protein product [Kluyveromyces dobzhanskii CBS 2104]
MLHPGRGSSEHTTQEENRSENRELQAVRGGSKSPEPVVSNKRKSTTEVEQKGYRYKAEMDILSDFMLKNFCAGVLIKYSALLVPYNPHVSDGDQEPSNVPVIKFADLLKFVRVVSSRTRANRHIYKAMCIISIKFLELSSKSRHNFLRYLKYDVRKLIVAALTLALRQRRSTVEADQPVRLVSAASGISCEQLRHCCDIVGPILKAQYQKTIRQQAPSAHAAHALSQDTIQEPNGSRNVHSAIRSNNTEPATNVRSTESGSATDLNSNLHDLYLSPTDYKQFDEKCKGMVSKSYLVK